MYADVDETLEDLLCVAHSRLDLVFGTSSTVDSIGDVLTGMTGAMLAKGLPAFEAACCACYLHGLAGDLCLDRYGEESVIARDLIEAIPDAFLRLRSAS